MKRSVVVVCLLAMLIPILARADEAPAPPASEPDFKKLYEEQKKRNDELERRLSLVEQRSTQDLYVAKEKVPEGTIKFLQQTELSGFVSASYFYDFNRPQSGEITGRGFDVHHDEFMANKFDLVLDKSVDYDAFEWKAGYKAELIFGQDAEFTQAGGLSLGDEGDLFVADVQVNVPIGNGLKVVFGKYQTVMGYEWSETELNANWSGGNQWTVLEPFTHTGLLMAYKWNNEWETQVLVNNGWDIVKDNNHSKSFMGIVTYTPNDNTSINLTGFGGPEQEDNDSNWRKGVDLVVTRKLTPKLAAAVQIDYGQEDGAKVIGSDVNGDPIVSGDAQWWAAGLWLTYDFSEKLQAALRTDYLNDINGARTSEAPALAPFPTNTGQELYSVTMTLNYKPLKEVRISPEFRWDHSTFDTAFDGHDSQFTAGFGAAYFY